MSTLHALSATADPVGRPTLSADPHAGPDATPATSPIDTIFIRGFHGETVIGIHDDELHRPQPVAIDLAAGRRHLPACDSDRIGDTIDYSAVRLRLLDYLQSHRHRLLEAFAEGLADLLLDEFGADWVQVAVAKPHKFPDVGSVGVQIERHRSPSSAKIVHDAEILRFLGRGLTPGKT